MTRSPLEPPNPYQSPAVATPSIEPAQAVHWRLHKILKDFRAQIVALGAFWIFIGAVATVLGALVANTNAGRREDLALFAAIVVAVMGLIWIGLGVMTYLKQIWAVYVALVLSYLSLASSVARFQICGIVVLLVVIVQAHRVLRWAKQLRSAGIPLTAKPQDLQIGISVPE